MSEQSFIKVVNTIYYENSIRSFLQSFVFSNFFFLDTSVNCESIKVFKENPNGTFLIYRDEFYDVKNKVLEEYGGNLLNNFKFMDNPSLPIFLVKMNMNILYSGEIYYSNVFQKTVKSIIETYITKPKLLSFKARTNSLERALESVPFFENLLNAYCIVPIEYIRSKKQFHCIILFVVIEFLDILVGILNKDNVTEEGFFLHQCCQYFNLTFFLHTKKLDGYYMYLPSQ